MDKRKQTKVSVSPCYYNEKLKTVIHCYEHGKRACNCGEKTIEKLERKGNKNHRWMTGFVFMLAFLIPLSTSAADYIVHGTLQKNDCNLDMEKLKDFKWSLYPYNNNYLLIDSSGQKIFSKSAHKNQLIFRWKDKHLRKWSFHIVLLLNEDGTFKGHYTTMAHSDYFGWCTVQYSLRGIRKEFSYE